MPARLAADYAFLENQMPAAELTRWVLQYSRRQELFLPEDRVLAAVSGGPDSTALLHLLTDLREELGISLAAAHFDHGLRGRESREDAAHAARQAAALGVPFHLGEGDVQAAAREQKSSLQMAARRLRLGFLTDTCRGHGYHKLALGHTADDQVELFLLRLLRGAGLEGLKGMPPATAAGLVRPLLAVGKKVLLAYLAERGISCREDASNLSRAYLRNRIRLDLLPELARRYNPRLSQALWRAQDLLQEDARLLAQETDRLLETVARLALPGFLALDLSPLLALDPAWQRRLVRVAAARTGADAALTAAQAASILDLARAERSGGRISLGRDLQVARAGDQLHFFREFSLPPAGIVTLLPAPPCQVEVADGWRWRLAVRSGPPEGPHPATGQAWMSLEKLTFPLTARYFRSGDRFWPPGAPGPRKLQDVLLDRKIPRWLRPRLPLAESGAQIIWVAGLGSAEPVKPAAGSQALELNLSPASPDTARIWEIIAALQSR